MRTTERRGTWATAALALLSLAVIASPGPRSIAETPPEKTTEGSDERRTHNVLVVTFDGLRWQEVFSGYAAALNTKEHGGVGNPQALARRFDAPTLEARRAKLLPFLWGTVARDGQILGDPAKESLVRVTNGLWFSYPGYSELLTGIVDPRIDSNAKRTNPNVNVLEWLSRRPGLEGRVAVFSSWDVFPYILAVERSGLPVNGEGPPFAEARTDRERLLNEFASDLPAYWGGARFDAPTMQGALEYLRTRQPRVLYVALDETDEWAHGRRYDLYLDAAHRSDRFLRRLWETAQSLPAYRGRTTLLVATDHGRGESPHDWTDHGQKVPAAERIWMAVMGPDTPVRGVRDGVAATQSQLAATVAHLLGEDFRADVPAAAAPLPGVVQ
jgi:hypothetical protein